LYRDSKNRERVLKGSAVKADFPLFSNQKGFCSAVTPLSFGFWAQLVQLFDFLWGGAAVRAAATSLSLLPPVALRPGHLTLTLRRAS
jgi:hypothetical protein